MMMMMMIIIIIIYLTANGLSPGGRGLRVKYPLLLSDCNETFSQHIFAKLSNIELHKNPSRRNGVVPCGQKEMTNLTVAFRSFFNASNNKIRCPGLINQAQNWNKWGINANMAMKLYIPQNVRNFTSLEKTWAFEERICSTEFVIGRKLGSHPKTVRFAVPSLINEATFESDASLQRILQQQPQCKFCI
jgi:hypothetical protein